MAIATHENVGSDSILDVPGSDPEKAVFFFSAMRLRNIRNVRFNFANVAKYADYNKIFFRDVFEVWYHKGLAGYTSNIDETTGFLRDIIRERDFKKVVFVGVSAGGFAAILFGTRVGANLVHAFSPRTFLDIERRLRFRDFRSKRNLLRLYSLRSLNKVLDLKPVLLQTEGVTKYFIHFCSGSRLDRIHASHLSQSRRVGLYAYRCGDHLVGQYLRNRQALWRILEAEEFEDVEKIHATLNGN